MSWNYRVIKRTYEDGTEIFTIHEVYYNDNGDPHMVTADPSEPQGETLEELKDDFEHYQRALSEPTLNYEDFGAQNVHSPGYFFSCPSSSPIL